MGEQVKPNRQEVGETGQVPNRQEVGETGQVPNRQESLEQLEAVELHGSATWRPSLAVSVAPLRWSPPSSSQASQPGFRPTGLRALWA
ncbi:MAG: hypothetical protein RBU37_27085 [Myxococcota bacterium]|nr:hypothetical protein [Myxococcota bacterium]